MLRCLASLVLVGSLIGCGGNGEVVSAGQSATLENVTVPESNTTIIRFLDQDKNYRFSGNNNTLLLSGSPNEIKIAGNNNNVEIYHSPKEIDVTGNDNSVKTRSDQSEIIDDRGSGNQLTTF